MKIICIGQNYVDHIKELSNKKSGSPLIFMKPDSSLISKNHPFIIPSFSDNIHHEVELIVKINRLGKHIDEKFSHKYYEEIGLGIDFTARDLQTDLRAKGHPWEKSKAFDNSCLVGGFLKKSQLNDVNNIDFELKKNNKIVQKGNSDKMIWKIDYLISYLLIYHKNFYYYIIMDCLSIHYIIFQIHCFLIQCIHLLIDFQKNSYILLY